MNRKINWEIAFKTLLNSGEEGISTSELDRLMYTSSTVTNNGLKNFLKKKGFELTLISKDLTLPGRPGKYGLRKLEVTI